MCKHPQEQLSEGLKCKGTASCSGSAPLFEQNELFAFRTQICWNEHAEPELIRLVEGQPPYSLGRFKRSSWRRSNCTWLPCVDIISFYYLEPNTRCHLFVNVLVVKSMSMFTGETGNDVGSLAPGLWKARCAVTEASVLSSNQLLCFFIIYYNVELKWGVYSAL